MKVKMHEFKLGHWHACITDDNSRGMGASSSPQNTKLAAVGDLILRYPRLLGLEIECFPFVPAEEKIDQA